VNPADLSNDADPKFLAEFYKNLKILSQDLYKKSVVASTNASAAVGSPPGKAAPKLGKFKQPSFSGKDRELQSSMQAAAAESAGAAGYSADHFSPESLQERMRMYAQQGAIPQEFLDRYAAGRGRGNTVGSEVDE
jgi:hypothetical protein